VDLCHRLLALWVTMYPHGTSKFVHIALALSVPAGLRLQANEEAVVSAACGPSHSVVLMANGVVYTAGANSEGQCGQDLGLKQVRSLQETAVHSHSMRPTYLQIMDTHAKQLA
jgi:alpha-tubulin suppressor-like RCC1 family protein